MNVNKKGLIAFLEIKNIALEQNAIRSYHQPTHNVALTEMQTHENTVMKKMRMTVERSYAQLKNRFAIVNTDRQWKMNDPERLHPVLMRLCFFLSNCMTCIHGDSLSKMCECYPPTLEEYLEPIQPAPF
jgi:hypothetical protein